MVDVNALKTNFPFVKLNEPLRLHCTFGIGGDAKIFAEPTTFEDLMELVDCLHNNKEAYKIVGNSSNILYSDLGFDGAIISTSQIKGMQRLSDNVMLVSAGEQLGAVANLAIKNGLGGLEFAVGIPATIGGAVVMNAGAFGSSISDVVKSVTYFDGSSLKTKTREELNFGYRKSMFCGRPEFVVMFTELELAKSSPCDLLKLANDNINKRKSSQPFGRSAGSVFKKADDIPAGYMIDKCGLKGYKVGGAEISTVHANFIVNNGDATSEDVLELIAVMKEKVKEKFDKHLELEIEIVGIDNGRKS